MTSFEVQENATITLVNNDIKSNSVLLRGHNGRFSAEVNLTVTAGGVTPGGNTTTSSKVWIWVVVVIVGVLLIVGIVFGVKHIGAGDDDSNKDYSL